jgi:formylglycine-generating enzyme required for sulfatase activity
MSKGNSRTSQAGDDSPDSPGFRELPQSWVNPRDGSFMRLVPAGEFIMGSTPGQIETARKMDIYGHEFTLSDELPQFRAFVPDFYLSEHAVTNAQFARFLSDARPLLPDELKHLAPMLEHIRVPKTPAGPYSVAPGFEGHPAIHVSWFGAETYCRWAGLRLPTEIEWEKAARGTDGRLYPWGNEWHDDYLRWAGDKRRPYDAPMPVDACPKGRSPYGIYQMAGNVDEWCADWYQWDIYRRYATGDLRPPETGERRAVRGGTCAGAKKILFRCAHRRGNDPGIVNVLYTGIRCAGDTARVMPAPVA